MKNKHDPAKQLVITNKIPWDYNPDAYNELADETLDRLACNDPVIRMLLEECIGYCFYRRNELGKGLKRIIINNAFTKSEKVQEQLDEYENENNPIKAFIEDNGVGSIENEATADVYKRYQVFCADNSMQPMSKIVFSKQINKRLHFATVSSRVDGTVRKIFVRE